LYPEARDGVVSTFAGGAFGIQNGSCFSIGIDAGGSIYVADTDINRIRKLSFK
jgi:hypothetical protein